MKAQDSVSYWFKVLEERGEYAYFTVIEECSDKSLIETDFFHGDTDGIGGFLSIMKERNEAEFLIPELPKRNSPHWLIFLVNFFRYLSRLPFYSPDWRLEAKWRRQNEKPSARAWVQLSKSETELLGKYAKEAGVGRNAYLLFHLDRAVALYLHNSIFPRYWLIPVSLRNNFLTLKGNITGFIDARLTKTTSLKMLDKNMRSALLRGDALGGYVGITLGRFIGPWLLKALVYLNDFIQVRTGVFTNLGNWKTKEDKPMSSSWFGFPPVIKAQPFGAMTGSMNGQQSLTVIFHPSLTRDKKVAEDVIRRWKAFLLREGP